MFIYENLKKLKHHKVVIRVLVIHVLVFAGLS